MTQQSKISLGWAIIHRKAQVPMSTRTGGHCRKLYSTAGQAKGAATQSFGRGRWEDFAEVVEVFCEVSQ